MSKKKKDDTLDEFELPEGITKEDLKNYWNESESAYAQSFKRAKVLDGTDRGKLWKSIGAKFPSYQVLPDTNHVSYVKNNLLASLYSVGRSADLQATTDEDRTTVEHLNLLLGHIWDTHQIGFYQMQAGERAALLNKGVTQIGWDADIVQGTSDYLKSGGLSIKNINPLKFRRDPYATSLENSAYCITWDSYHKNVILRNDEYNARFKEYLETNKNSKITSASVEYNTDQPQKPSKDYYRVTVFWVMIEKKLHVIHTIDSDYVLRVQEDVKPGLYPFAELYCNLPCEDVMGTSEPSRIFANSVAYNLMNSVILTSEVKNQKPPKFINKHSGINVRQFIKHGADSDYTFIVEGDASKAVHYHEFPQPSQMIRSIMDSLGMDIQQVTGVDGRYTGKDSGSVLTTGGIEQMLDQATLVDQPKIVNYEQYTVALTRLILGNLREYGNTRKYFVHDPESGEDKTIEVDFPQLKDDTIFDYSINISAHLPKNKQRIAQMANVIMEKQMQYNQGGQQQVELLTAEEWLYMQDLPQRELMLKRMKIERSKNYIDEVAKIIFTYADMLDKGVLPEDALMQTAEMMQGGQPTMDPGMGMQPDMGPEMGDMGAPPPDMGQELQY